MVRGRVAALRRAPNQKRPTDSPLSTSAKAWLTRLMGMAKPMPWAPICGRNVATLMPMRSPRKLMSGPPELPGLMAASVWIQSKVSSSPRERSSLGPRRARELKMPRLTEPAYPKGLPKAMTVSPSKRSSSLANLTAGNFRPGDLSLSNATSLAALSATRSASMGSDPSLNFTNTRFTPSTT